MNSDRIDSLVSEYENRHSSYFLHERTAHRQVPDLSIVIRDGFILIARVAEALLPYPSVAEIESSNEEGKLPNKWIHLKCDACDRYINLKADTITIDTIGPNCEVAIRSHDKYCACCPYGCSSYLIPVCPDNKQIRANSYE